MADLTRAFRMPVGAMEAGASLLSGAVAEPVAGWAGILSGGNADKVAATREALTYQPRTEAGKESMAGIADIMGAIKDAAMRSPVGTAVNGFNAMADRAGAVSPALGAAVKTVPAAAAMLLGPGGTATRQAVANVAKGTGQGVARGVAAAAENAAAVPAVRGPLANQDGIFAGHLAKNAPTWKLEQAKTLEARGLSDREIYAQTGWFKGLPDGQWRFEIPDNEARFSAAATQPDRQFMEVGVGRMGDAMKHPQLSDAYPHLDDMALELNPNMKAQGSYSDGVVQINRSSEPVRRAELRDWERRLQEEATPEQIEADVQYLMQDGVTREEALQIVRDTHAEELAKVRKDLSNADFTPAQTSTALHELQHAVQEHEGFAPGGSSSALYHTTANPRIAEINALLSTDVDPQTYQALLREKRELLAQELSPQESYRRLAGEAEARLTQARQHMTPEERAASYPLDMLDVPVSDLIVRPR